MTYRILLLLLSFSGVSFCSDQEQEKKSANNASIVDQLVIIYGIERYMINHALEAEQHPGSNLGATPVWRYSPSDHKVRYESTFGRLTDEGMRDVICGNYTYSDHFGHTPTYGWAQFKINNNAEHAYKGLLIVGSCDANLHNLLRKQMAHRDIELWQKLRKKRIEEELTKKSEGA